MIALIGYCQSLVDSLKFLGIGAHDQIATNCHC